MSIVKRLKEYIDAKHITVSKFEKQVGLSNASFGKPLKKNGAIGSDKLEKILSVYSDINPQWLLFGTGEMFMESSELYPDDHQSPVALSDHKIKYGTVSGIPLYSLREGLSSITEKSAPIEDYLSVPDGDKFDGAVRIKGIVAHGGIANGDIILFKTVEDFSDLLPGYEYLVSYDYQGSEIVAAGAVSDPAEGIQIYSADGKLVKLSPDKISSMVVILGYLRFQTMM